MMDKLINKGGGCYMSITIISRDSELGLTQKKLEGYKKYSEIIQYGRKNPVKFAETFLGVT